MGSRGEEVQLVRCTARWSKCSCFGRCIRRWGKV